MKIVLNYLLLLTLLFNLSFCINDNLLKYFWKKFKTNYGKTYLMTELEEYRMGIFKKNFEFIEKHNTEYSMGMYTYTLGINYFADWTAEEFKEKMLGLEANFTALKEGSTFTILKLPSEVKVDDSLDWREKNVVTKVKNQGECRSCWAFSTTGSLEGAYARFTNKLVSLSEQQLVDCSRDYGNSGCNGSGMVTYALNYVWDVGGIESENDYPYYAEEGDCQFRKSNIVVKCNGYAFLTTDDENVLKGAVASYGPISVLIKVNEKFMFYKEGVFYDEKCNDGPINLNHAVLVVGYGNNINKIFGEEEFWIVKNSWGTGWGEKGYIRMARNKQNMCFIAKAATFPLIKLN